MEDAINIAVDYYESGYCQLHALVVGGKYNGFHAVAIDVMSFDRNNLPEITELNWHNVSDPDGYAEPSYPIQTRLVQTFKWSES